MNLNVYIICVAAAVFFVVPASANSTATIHGEVYGWDTFEPLENAVVEINSTPSQSMVAKYGVYSFELEPGDYLIKASYYQNSTLIYSAEKTVIIKGEGSYVFDLLLLPLYSEELMDSPEDTDYSSTIIQKVSNESDSVNNPDSDNLSDGNASIVESNEINGFTSSIGYYLLTALVLSLFLAGGYKFQKYRSIEENKLEKNRLLEEKADHKTEKLPVPVSTPDFSAKVPVEDKETSSEETSPKKPALVPEPTKIPEPEAPAIKKNLPLPADLQDIMDIIRGQGGRITQKDLRTKLKYSEGKVSLMLADLERRELIEKFKRGRGNVVILRDEER